MLRVKGILLHPHLFRPRAIQAGDEPKYSVSLLIPKNDPQCAVIAAEIQAAKQNGFPSGFPGNGKVCWKDCAVQWPDRPNLAGYMCLSMTSKADKRPYVVDTNITPVMDPSQVYQGAEAWVAVNIASYSLPMAKGIGGYVNGVMLTGNEGALGRLDNSQTAEQMFAGVAGNTAAPQPNAPTYGAPGQPSYPTPPAPPAAPAPSAAYVMTPKAGGFSREQLIEKGWTDENLIKHGMMLPPNGAPMPWEDDIPY